MIKDRKFYKTIFMLSLPAAFQALVSFLVVIVDDLMVSSIGDGMTAQAAVAQVNSITAFYTATVMGVVSGSAVLISQYWGKKDTDRIKMIFSIVMRICIALSIVFAVLASIFPRQIVGFVISNKEEAVTQLAVDYFRIACFSFIPFAITNALVGMLRSVEVVKVALYITFAALLVNVGLNYVLIFGKLGFPAMGVKGAAIATLSARIVEMIIVLFYTFKRQKRIDIKPSDFLKRSEKWLLKDYAKFGLPVAITDLQWSFIGMLKAAIIGQLGASFMAANAIASSFANLATIFTFSLAGGACVVVGKAVGAGDYDLVRKMSKTIQIMFLGIGLVSSALVFFLRGPFTSLYGSSSNPEVYTLSTQMIALLAITLIGTSYHASCFVGINRGAGDSRFVAIVDMICGWLVVLPITLLAAFVWKLPLPLVFLATRIDQCFKWIIAFFRLRGNKWIKNVTKPSEESLVEEIVDEVAEEVVEISK